MSNAERDRLASQKAFLARETRARALAEEKVHTSSVALVESGVRGDVTVEELELLEQRKRVLDLTSELREHVSGWSALLENKPLATADEPEIPGQKRPRVYGIDLGHEDDFALESATPESAAAFIPLEAREIQRRVEEGLFRPVVTEETLREEREKARSNKQRDIQACRQSLPIFKRRKDLVDCIRKHQAVIVIGETGSGKTTQLLQYLLEEGFCDDVESEEPLRLVCTQPRRLAATSVAERVAEEMGERCGATTGYKVRFAEKSSEATRILFVTDGIMLREMTHDPDLSRYAAIMIDEAHERSLNTDILLGLLKDLMLRNKRIRIIISSATIQAEKFSKFFGNAPLIKIEGRTFPVQVRYAPETQADIVQSSAEVVMEIHQNFPCPGDVLVFLSGQEEIENCARALQEKADALRGSIRELRILPLYSALPPDEQRRIYDPTPEGCRKVVIATNLAETSITIDGIVYVVDSGFSKLNFYNSNTMMDELTEVQISQASANQRKGRAGRTRPGECWRLYTKFTFQNMEKETPAEIERCTISSVVLQLKALGINRLDCFPFLDAPKPEELLRSLQHLKLLGALKEDETMTKLGLKMSFFPMEPSMSKMILAAGKLRCARHIAMAASILSVDGSLYRMTRKPEEERIREQQKELLYATGNGDVFGYIRTFDEWLRCYEGPQRTEFEKRNFLNGKTLLKARDILDQLLRIFEAPEISIDYKSEETVIDLEKITKALISGFFPNVAVLAMDARSLNGGYYPVKPVSMFMGGRLGTGKVAVEIHPSSYYRNEKFVRKPSDVAGGVLQQPAAIQQRPELIVFVQLRMTKRPFAMHVTNLTDRIDWVLQCSPRNYFTKDELAGALKRRTY